MAEHDEKAFEHILEAEFRKLDEKIKIPEIPDAQSIFEKAEKEKANTVPFKKYSKYIAAAAAVVLICVSVPIAANAISGGVPRENAEAPMMLADIFNSKNQDAAEPEPECAVEAEMDPNSSEQKERAEEPVPEEAPEDGTVLDENAVVNALMDYFTEFSFTAKEELDDIKEHIEVSSSVASSSGAVPSAGNNPNTGGGNDDVEFIEEQINKKRSIEITLEEDSVSVVLFDCSSAEKEILNAFWVEGDFEGCYTKDDYYVINLSKTITPEDLKSGVYLPMAGDAQNGNYTIPAESVFISEKVTKGIIYLAVEIDVGTGEYKIYASLV